MGTHPTVLALNGLTQRTGGLSPSVIGLSGAFHLQGGKRGSRKESCSSVKLIAEGIPQPQKSLTGLVSGLMSSPLPPQVRIQNSACHPTHEFFTGDEISAMIVVVVSSSRVRLPGNGGAGGTLIQAPIVSLRLG